MLCASLNDLLFLSAGVLPQRAAAAAVAQQMAAELRCHLGRQVGFCAHFQDVTTPVRPPPQKLSLFMRPHETVWDLQDSASHNV